MWETTYNEFAASHACGKGHRGIRPCF
jgi:hypothetical protein